eukprot:1846547-Rhodomonas_salina.1
MLVQRGQAAAPGTATHMAGQASAAHMAGFSQLQQAQAQVQAQHAAFQQFHQARVQAAWATLACPVQLGPQAGFVTTGAGVVPVGLPPSLRGAAAAQRPAVNANVVRGPHFTAAR